MVEAYPLSWPEGWPRTPDDRQKRGDEFKHLDFAKGYRVRVPFTKARDSLYDELRRLGAQHAVISSNFPTDRYGAPVEGKRKPADEGIAVYFTLGGKAMAMAADRYSNAAANMRSLALAIEAMRQLERHGGGTMMERAFAGFAALPPPKQWWEVLGVYRNASEEEIDRAWRAKSKRAHPDVGGSHAAMSQLNEARNLGLQAVRATA